MSNKYFGIEQPPLLFPFPNITSKQIILIPPRKVEIFEYFIISDGFKRVFTTEDCIRHIRNQEFRDISEVSFTNLFINGVLQPRVNYEILDGKIILRTIDAPIKGSPIILQMIKC